MSRSELCTVRFSPEELSLVKQYLQQNPAFDSFSSLARIATLSFVGERAYLRLERVGQEVTRRPRFLWDYDLTETQVREILSRPGLPGEKRWLTERILTQARFEEIISYLSLAAIRQALPQLRLPEKVRKRWEYALTRWKLHG